MRFRRALILLVAAVALSAPVPVLAQALPNLTLLRVRYNSAKTAAKPDGDLKAQIDQIDKELADATRAGRTGEQRRLFAKGQALLDGRSWTDADDFQASLVLRTDAVVIDSTRPHTVRLEQIFVPSIALSHPLTAVASIAPPAAPAGGASRPVAAPMELARFDGVARDLRESPLAMDLDFSKVPDGPHVLSVAVRHGEQPIGTATLRVALRNGLDAHLRKLESEAAAAVPAIRADLAYPADFVRKINRGQVELGGFDIGAELSAADGIAAAAKGGRNPFAGKTGGFERHYLLEDANEIMPYRVYVPPSYNGSRPYPLIVALHGLGANEDSFMDSYAKTVPALAEARGYIVVAPLGYRVDGFYGFNLQIGEPSAADRRRSELSERDVMEVLKRIRADYKVDDSRVYLMGHSMGAIGTWAIGAKYPDIWAALAAFSGLGNPATVAGMKHIPEIIVHGDADPTVPVNGSRAMVEAMKKLGVDYKYIEVPGGNHVDVVVPNLEAVFDFFDSKRKATAATQQ